MPDVPDFIIIGAMKCATSTLHEQLARQPGIFMSTPKEPNFFSNDDVYARGWDWYRGLFAQGAAARLRGESSTHYTKLPTYPNTVDRIRRHLPGAKFIYLMRHPIDRLISQYVHEWTEHVVKCSIDDALDRRPELIAYSRYAMQLAPYFDAFGRERVLPVFFERLKERPQAELERICRFLGYDGAPVWDFDLKEQNISSERLRLGKLHLFLLNFPPLAFLRRNFVPQFIRDRVKQRLSINERPEISLRKLDGLKAIFNADLAKLGQWLGLELTCDTYVASVLRQCPEWVPAPTCT